MGEKKRAFFVSEFRDVINTFYLINLRRFVLWKTFKCYLSRELSANLAKPS